MAFITVRISLLRGRPPGEAGGISAMPAAPIRYPLGRSGTLPLRADKFGDAPASTSSSAVTRNPTTREYPATPISTTLWVRRLAGHSTRRDPPRAQHNLHGQRSLPFSISRVAWFDRFTMRAVAQYVRRDPAGEAGLIAVAGDGPILAADLPADPESSEER
jgi:hypothetical protein